MLVVSASLERFYETLGSYGQNVQGKKKPFSRLKSATTVIGFDSDLKLSAFETLI